MSIDETVLFEKLPLGSDTPRFVLPDVVSGGNVSPSRYARRPLLVAFLANHCPYVRHMEHALGELSSEHANSELAIVGIAPNDVVSYPDDGPDGMRDQALRAGFRFPYLLDERQQAARDFGAQATPDFFLFDRKHRLTYHGRFDASRPGSDVPVTGDELRRAIAAVLSGKMAPTEQYPSVGCSIKWAERR